MKEHISKSKINNEYAFHQALNKYGVDNFEWVILSTTNNQKDLDDKESYWIKYFNTFYCGGYNMQTGGQHNKIYDDNAEELSLMHGGIWRDDSYCIFIYYFI